VINSFGIGSFIVSRYNKFDNRRMCLGGFVVRSSSSDVRLGGVRC
jgi:hypothetical protein